MALWRIRATVDDRPGYLSVLTASLALRSVNILSVQVHTTEAGAVDDFLVDAPDALSEKDLLAAVERGRGQDCWVARTEAKVLMDLPTRALGLARRLVRDPERLDVALRDLLGATEVTWRPVRPPAPRGGDPEQPERQPRPGFGETSMVLADPAGGSFEVTRDAPGFTPAEYARAQALVDLAAAAAERDLDRGVVLLPDGAEVELRAATASDLPAVRRMHDRCSPDSRRRRYLNPDPPGDRQLHRLLDPPRGAGLVAVADDPAGDGTRVVALAGLLADGDLAEAAILVEDAWQRRGIGTALARRLVTHARRDGYAALVGHATAGDEALPRLLRRVAPQARTDRDGQVVTVMLPLALGAPAPETPAAAGA
ncbi:GNAT family N-acetyltransferase [Plantactinospora sp. KBS50]|uniref:GNAT family N-acetyltransferase n=1 Tax=Plantactinospora sp. KBS50 TaxID=2024580 RepID=UPI000BAAE5F4|nr:GNAT family N-acetyltransferase [Plantactinospora sp. KBS50]ASW54229.1 GNAT family N-acetyltransferase [Plantactinospora sp. KBS50]